MSTIHYVKHRLIAADELRGKDIAWCEGGTPTRMHMIVGEPRAQDGHYTLHLWSVRVPPPDGKPEGGVVFDKESADQTIVDSILRVPPSSDLALRLFEFAIIRDKMSEFLLTPRTNRE